MKSKTVMVLLALLAMVLVAAGCSKQEPAGAEGGGAQPAQQQAKAEPIDPATAAAVNGTVKFEGTPPKAAKIDMAQDPACKGQTVSEAVVVESGNLANTLVYVKEGLGNRSFDTPKEPVTIDQEGCRYHPHVVAVMAGQEVRILNSDPTTHNIHPTPKNNREWNESQPPKGEALVKTFAREELMMPVKCNQHPWMKMYVNVVKHPFYAVTDKDGKFELKGLPPGEYTIAAVHEKYGEQTQKLTVGASETKSAEFTYSEGGAKAGGLQ